MHQLDHKQLNQHIEIVGWLHIIGGVLFLAIAAFVFFLLTGISIAANDAQAFAVLTVVATSVAALLSVLAIPGIVAGIGVLRHKSWGRILAIVMGILNLINFPIGTLIGAYTLWVLMQENTTDLFAGGAMTLHPGVG